MTMCCFITWITLLCSCFFQKEIFAYSAISNGYSLRFPTAGSYTRFLNSVAKSDPHGLFNERMENSIPSIVRHGTPGEYYYTVASEEKKLPLCTACPISLMRQCNWLENKNTEDPSIEMTETGVYEIEDDTLYSVNPASTFLLFDQDGKQLDPFSPENSDPLLECSNLNISIGKKIPPSQNNKDFSLSELVSSQKKVAVPEKHPLERKALKVIAWYSCPVLGMLAGISISTSFTIGGPIALVAAGAGIGAILGMVAGTIAAHLIAEKLNQWLGAP